MNFEALFRKYDIRGVFVQDFSVSDFYELVRATLQICSQEFGETNKSVAIGKDLRPSGEVLHKAAIQACIDEGWKVFDLEFASTPLLYSVYKIDESIPLRLMITASHNSWDCNGLKIFYKDEMLQETFLKLVKKYLVEQTFSLEVASGGEHFVTKQFHQKYLEKINECFSPMKIKQSFLIDFMNGSGAVFKHYWTEHQRTPLSHFTRDVQLQKDFVENFSPDPTNLENLEQTLQKMREKNAAFSLLFDGDADRFAVLLSDGTLMLGDRLLPIFSKFSESKVCSVVTDVVNFGLMDEVAVQNKIVLIKSPVGIATVKKVMHEFSSEIAGEFSGHFLFADNPFNTDDGLFAALKFLKIVESVGGYIENITQLLPCNYYSFAKRIFFHSKFLAKRKIEKIKKMLLDQHFEVSAIDGYFFEKDDLKILVRLSNTENCYTLKILAQNQNIVENSKKFIMGIL